MLTAEGFSLGESMKTDKINLEIIKHLRDGRKSFKVIAMSSPSPRTPSEPASTNWPRKESWKFQGS